MIITESRRIILNTLASYGKSLITLPLHLLIARWLLKGLGTEDYGLNGVVGGVVFFITFINAVSAQAVSRFYAFSVGVDKRAGCEGGQSVAEVQRWFNVALAVHIALPLILLTLGYPIGVYAIEHWLVIPAPRVQTAVWVFRMSLATAFFAMIFVPYIALYMAHQLIINLTVFTLLDCVINAVFVFYLASMDGDHLIIYSIGMFMIHVGLRFVQAVCAYRMFPAARIEPRLMVDFRRIGEILSFAWWRLFASAGWMLRSQGCAFLVNLNFGVKANAAISVANQLSGQTAAFSSHLCNAMMPAIVTATGAGRKEHAVDLVFSGCKFGALLVLLFSIPMILECEEVLKLWLGNPPAEAAKLCVYMVVSFALDRFTSGHEYVLTANGKMAAWQTWEAFANAAALLVGWGFIMCGFGVSSVGIAYVVTTALIGLGRIHFARRIAEIHVRPWLNIVIRPVFRALILTGIAGGLVVAFVRQGFVRLCMTSLTCGAVLLFTSWVCSFNADEKQYVISGVEKIGRMVRRKR